MSNATDNLVRTPYGSGGRMVNLPIDGGAHIYNGVMVSQLTATGMLVAGSTALSGPCCGVSTHEQDNTAGADAALRCLVENDHIESFANATGGNACSEATPFGSVVYMYDDHTISDNSVGDTLFPAGYFAGMEPNGRVRVYFPISRIGALDDVGEVTQYSTHGVRGMTTANIANLAAFTVANDGITLIEGDRVFLPFQTAGAANGIYRLGAVAAGTAPLTRALDADGADEIVPGMVVFVSEGTFGQNKRFELTNDQPIAIGTTVLRFQQVGALLPTAVGQVLRATVLQTATVPGEMAYGAVDLGNASAITGVAPSANIASHTGDVSGAHAATTVDKVKGTTITTAGGALAVGACLRTTAVGTADWGALDVADADAVTGSLRANNETPHEVRYVMTANVANLAAFTVAQDGVTGVETERVLLANQTVAAESGVYVIGAVNAGTAPLTRVPWLFTGAVVKGGYTVNVNEGTLNGYSSWFAVAAGNITIGTTAHAWYPESITQSAPFPINTGYLPITNVPILSATKTMMNVINIAEVTADLTVRYSRRPATVAAGTVGTATIEVMAEIAAGGVNVDDDSTLLVQIVNR